MPPEEQRFGTLIKICGIRSADHARRALDAGADAVYIGLRDNTNARAFGGLNFDAAAARAGIAYAHARGAEVLLAINTYPQPDTWTRWTAAVDTAAALGVDAVFSDFPS